MNLRDLILYSIGTTSSFENEGIYWMIGSQSYMAIFNLTVGLILIFKANWVTEKVKPSSTENLSISLDKTDWIELSIITISGLTILYSVPEIMYKLVNFIYFNDYNENEKQVFWTNRNKADIFYSIFKFVAGLFFLLNARNFAGRLKKIGDKDDNLGE